MTEGVLRDGTRFKYVDNWQTVGKPQRMCDEWIGTTAFYSAQNSKKVLKLLGVDESQCARRGSSSSWRSNGTWNAHNTDGAGTTHDVGCRGELKGELMVSNVGGPWSQFGNTNDVLQERQTWADLASEDEG